LRTHCRPRRYPLTAVTDRPRDTTDQGRKGHDI